LQDLGDIVFEKVIDHIDAEIKQCPQCDAINKGSFPADRQGQLQYGDGIKAFIINLLVMQMVSLNRVQKLVKSIMGTVIAEATLLRFVLRLHQVAHPPLLFTFLLLRRGRREVAESPRCAIVPTWHQ